MKERQFVLFFVFSTLFVIAWAGLQAFVVKPEEEVVQNEEPNQQQPNQQQPNQQQPNQQQEDKINKPSNEEKNKKADLNETGESDKKNDDIQEGQETQQPQVNKNAPLKITEPELEERLTLGSLDPESPYRLLVTFNNCGGAVERIQLNGKRYRNLENRKGYLGHLIYEEVPQGLKVTFPLAGTGVPAERLGLVEGDILTAIGQETADNLLTRESDLVDYLRTTKPEKTVTISVLRNKTETTNEEEPSLQTVLLTGKLGREPLSVIRPEPYRTTDKNSPHRNSYLLSLDRYNRTNVAIDKAEIDGLPSLHRRKWFAKKIEKNGEQTVEFSTILEPEELKAIGEVGRLEIIKRYRLNPAAQSGSQGLGYLLDYEIEIVNHSSNKISVALRQEGANGLPYDGWWYTTKIHPGFSGAGARDVVWREKGLSRSFMGSPALVPNSLDQGEHTSLFVSNDAASLTHLDYIGVDSQYFSSMLMAVEESEKDMAFMQAYAYTLNDSKDFGQVFEHKRSNNTFRVVTPEYQLSGSETESNRKVFQYQIFAGPKEPTVLETNKIADSIEYGWFGFVSKPMLGILHLLGFAGYGIGIVLLTVVVRLCLLPLGRKAAKGAQIQQMLAPQLKALRDKHKKEPEKYLKAQQELFKKHGYNPLSGCFVMFFQLPIFLGLYRGLSVDIELYGRPLLWEGFAWCSNLAAPDRFWHWEAYLPTWIGGETGYLGPYLNILPLVTIVLFIVQQKLFTPPATDEQTKQMQQMMMGMTVMIAFLFFKVPAGLCIYFITSSLWGIGERLLLPKPTVDTISDKKNLENEKKRSDQIERKNEKKKIQKKLQKK
ncbi:MAG: YidC/Oxa1 family insertase periplasmic-domain containing protein [Pirellulaceae bacterium]|nr:YidC/Oxa1 family insertase periplasmic-domain containing protein [Pirellulaceae bacterium]